MSTIAQLTEGLGGRKRQLNKSEANKDFKGFGRRKEEMTGNK